MYDPDVEEIGRNFVFPLIEGDITRCFSVPLYAEEQYLGILYTLYSALENVACQLSIRCGIPAHYI